ncbi:MAG: acetylxylan esterase [Verrucomicrobiae bacterium]|nr:acetylxylan esterase [Verrucomicrobiae bacterium]
MGTRQDWNGVKGTYSSSLPWEKERWYKVKTTVSVKDLKMQHYRDDVKVGEGPLPQDYTFGEGDIHIGGYQRNSSPMHGWIDEVKIYGKTLSAEAYPPTLSVTLARQDGVYKIGEKAEFQISAKKINGEAFAGIADYLLTLDGGKKLGDGKVTLGATPAVIPFSLATPGVVRCVITHKDGQTTVSALAAAAFDPEKIQPSIKEPEDFGSFWNAKKAELSKIPVEPLLEKSDKYSKPDVTVYKIRLASINGAHVYGWLGVPAGNGPFPAVLTLPWAGVYPIDGNPDGGWVGYARKGCLAMGITIHDCEPDLPPEAYAKLPQVAGYPTVGRENRETCYYLRAYLGCVRAIDYITSRPDWDKKNMIVQGSSQGGGLTVVTAGLDPRVTAIAANVPALCEHAGKFSERPSGWPQLVPDGNENVARVSAYFDAVNFARRIRCPAILSVGLIDTTCPPMTVYSAFNVMQGPKQLVVTPRLGHVSSKEFTEASQRWIAEFISKKTKTN